MTHLQGQDRAKYVQNMFGRIAHRYDLMNRLMTFGQDMKWRRFVVEKAAIPAGGTVLDLAIGTGDIAFAALESDPSLRAHGADFALPMMQVGQQRHYGKRVRWVQADALALPYRNDSFDAVVSGYLLRNVIDLEGCLREQWRVLRPGGMIVALDTSPPPRSLLRPFVAFHLRYVIPFLGRAISGSPDAYEYLPSSTTAFKTPEELRILLHKAGFDDVGYRTYVFGSMAVHWGMKPLA